ncbi:MAG: outer membrane protein assembly factor BamE [Gammaproteobacteria bacterium]|nr:outer membrane protein assembly factor BamE [Gammaproteobacteria bacterium]
MIQRGIKILIFSLALSGCVHKTDVEQGNVITKDTLKQIHAGMSAEQVKEVLGTPILKHGFNKNQLDYVYTFHPGRGSTTVKYISLAFEKERLKRIDGNLALPGLPAVR